MRRIFLIEELMRGIFILVEILVIMGIIGGKSNYWIVWTAADIVVRKHTGSLVLLVFTNTHWSNSVNKALLKGWACLVAAQLCVSVAPSLINPQHLSQFNTDNPLHLLTLPVSIISLPLSIFCLSLQSHMKACLTYACQRNILHHEDKSWEEKEKANWLMSPLKTHTNTHTQLHPPVPTARARVGHRRWGAGHSYSLPAAWQLQTLSFGNLQTHRPIMCLCVDTFFLSWTMIPGSPWSPTNGKRPPRFPFFPVRWNCAGRLAYH